MQTDFAFLASDPAEDRFSVSSELALLAAYDVSAVLTAAADIRNDFATATTTEAGLDLTYTNECVEVALSISRTLSSSDTLHGWAGPAFCHLRVKEV